MDRPERVLLVIAAYLALGVFVFGVAETWVAFGRDEVVRRLPSLGRSVLAVLLGVAIVWSVLSLGLDPLLVAVAGLVATVVAVALARRHPRPRSQEQAGHAAAMRTSRGRVVRIAEIVWVVVLFVAMPALIAALPGS